MRTVTVSLYKAEPDPSHGEDHIVDIVLEDFDDLRDSNDKIYSGRLPNQQRIFVHIKD